MALSSQRQLHAALSHGPAAGHAAALEAHPHLLPTEAAADPGSPDALHHAVAYVGGMTDRYACRQAVTLLGWPQERLPRGIDTAG